MNSRRLILFALLIATLSFLNLKCGCGGSSPKDGDTFSEELTSETGTPVTEDPYTQMEVQEKGDVDILLMLDSSQSLAEERQKIADALPHLVAELTEVNSAAVAFALGWVSSTPDPLYEGSGHLYRLNGNPWVAESSDPSSDPTVIGDVIASTLSVNNPLPWDEAADGGEAGMFSFSRLLVNPLPEEAVNHFFRPEAGLVVIFVSDENDICAIYPDGVERVEDPEGREDSARATYCPDGISGSSLFEMAKNAKGSALVQFDGLIYTGTVPEGIENEIGYGYLDAIDTTNGVRVDLASTDFSQGLRNLGNAINALVAKIQRKFTLLQAPVNPLSIQVKVDGEPVTFRFIEAENAVVLDYAGHGGSIIEIFYRVL